MDSYNEKRFRYARYVLNNGYNPQEKSEILEKIGYPIKSFHGDSQEEHHRKIQQIKDPEDLNQYS